MAVPPFPVCWPNTPGAAAIAVAAAPVFSIFRLIGSIIGFPLDGCHGPCVLIGGAHSYSTAAVALRVIGESNETSACSTSQLLDFSTLHVIDVAGGQYEVRLFPRLVRARVIVDGDFPRSKHLKAITANNNGCSFR